ncbi:MAG: flagellar type III secretion system protein FlhA [Planctomycetes bacterium]|jgi:flagellar biosynthesis protein FlhA|nr:FHIPEP family type III secretion protein [Phycisphaerae bacterium]NBB94698.1 flagellar type III secretion system protein FlhA [Planctomycetota bacterium]
MMPAGLQQTDRAGRLRGYIVPSAAAALIFVVLVPLPPVVMDVLLAGSITLAAVVFLTTIFVSSPMEFSVFPSVLLGATLLRLVLNIATTRLILTAGEGGGGAGQAHLAAGRVIWTFSEFVASGSLAVGVILFAIIAIIQFVVITKGAARISEVAARFVLDAMPGRQMAIDADLNAGLIDESEARSRREDVAARADFYGAMDGASKFLRGDAIAAVVITLVNIGGGLYVGMVQYGWSWGETVGLFSRLTIGDGLVAQIPALLVSVSAALMVTRATARANLGEEVFGQLTRRPAVLVVTAAFLGVLMLTSLPTLPLALLAAGCLLTAWRLKAGRGGETVEPTDATRDADGTEGIEPAPVRPMQIDLGYALIPLVDRETGGDLVDRLGHLRERLGERLGLVIPPVWIRDNMNIRAHEYRICLRGAVVATGRLRPSRLLASGDVETVRRLGGTPSGRIDDGRTGTWIARGQRPVAEMAGLRVREPADALVDHVEIVVTGHAAELLSRQRVADMLSALEPTAGDVVAEARRKLSLGRIQRLLHRLLSERVSLRDREAVLEAICEAAEASDDFDDQVRIIRERLGRCLCQPWLDGEGRLWCVTTSPQFDALARRMAAEPAAVRLRDMEAAIESLRAAIESLTRDGRTAVVVCGAAARQAVLRLLRRRDIVAVVLGHNETTGLLLQSVAEVTAERATEDSVAAAPAKQA